MESEVATLQQRLQEAHAKSQDDRLAMFRRQAAAMQRKISDREAELEQLRVQQESLKRQLQEKVRAHKRAGESSRVARREARDERSEARGERRELAWRVARGAVALATDCGGEASAHPAGGRCGQGLRGGSCCPCHPPPAPPTTLVTRRCLVPSLSPSPCSPRSVPHRRRR